VHRHSWLLLYLFGASPAVCKSFLRGQSVSLEEYDANTWYGPYATSLRMSDIGYTNRKRCALKVNTTVWPVTPTACCTCRAPTPVRPYQAIGVEVDGEFRQLSGNILQIEDEYYSVMRPKQPFRSRASGRLQALMPAGGGLCRAAYQRSRCVRAGRHRATASRGFWRRS
jgi:glutamate--cysteine ligase